MDISNTDDIIDSRDVIARIEELETDSDELEAIGGPEELIALKALAEEGADYGADWQYGEALIRDSYFKEYAQDLADDCGMIDTAATWPGNCIDWDRAVDELKMDYTLIAFDGVDYWIRS